MSAPITSIINYYGYICTVPLGLIGHLCSLITFSSKTLRETSVGLLFIFLCISDMLYLFIPTYDFLNSIPQLSLNLSEETCRFRAFIMNFSSVTSAWLLVLISLDRLICVRFPYQYGRLFTQKLVVCSTIVLCVCSILFTCHVLKSEFGFASQPPGVCGVIRSPPTSYTIFYLNVWPTLQLLITYLIPICLMIVSGIQVCYKTQRQVALTVVSVRREKAQRQMVILMASSIACFIICTVPYAVNRMVILRYGNNSTSALLIGIFGNLLNMNYCYNFYIHCLTASLFRQKFIEQVKWFLLRCKRRLGLNTAVVQPLQMKTIPRGTLKNTGQLNK